MQKKVRHYVNPDDNAEIFNTEETRLIEENGRCTDMEPTFNANSPLEVTNVEI